MRLRPLLIALVVWTASRGALAAAEPPSQPLIPSSAPSGSARAIYFGMMGEVAHPGVYAATANWTLTELIKKAGGITPEANKTVRVFRGGLLAEQVFLGSGEAPSLLPNDLIVVGARGSSEQTPRTAEASPEPNASPAVSAVQIAFLNLIDRPVIVKMAGDQASLTHIVELLGQPADCAAKIHVFGPLGAGPRGSDSIDEATRPLESGTVLVFPSPPIRLETLPALPEPIAETSLIPPAVPPPPSAPMAHSGPIPVHSTSVPELHSQPVVGQAASLPQTVKQAGSLPYDSTAARPSDIAPHVEPEHARHPFVQADELTQAAASTPTLARSANESHAGRMVALMAAMSAVAGLAMLLTFASIAQRWISSDKRHPRRSGAGSSDSSPAVLSAGVPAPPLPAGPSRVGRPIRIDAGRAVTRLSIDLAVMERTTHSLPTR